MRKKDRLRNKTSLNIKLRLAFHSPGGWAEYPAAWCIPIRVRVAERTTAPGVPK